jgi:F0F1-type ATP synthase assembly protein I
MEHGDHRFKARAPSGGASAAAGLGFQFAASLVLFFFAGQWLDRRLGTAPVFLLIGVFVGGGGSFYSMYRRLMAAQRREDEAKAAARAAESARKTDADS